MHPFICKSLALFSLVVASATGFAACNLEASSEHHDSPYAEQETRQIKALSDADLASYRAGSGMGFAKPAELNHYPGPKHVLELSKELALTSVQRQTIRLSHATMKESAVYLGSRIIDKEALLDSLFAAAVADSGSVRALVHEIAILKGHLRFSHLLAHVETRDMLTTDQIGRYDTLRGYAGSVSPPGHASRHENGSGDE